MPTPAITASQIRHALSSSNTSTPTHLALQTAGRGLPLVMSASFDPATVDKLNLLSTFLAQDDGPPPPHTRGTVYVLAGSAIIHITDSLFAHLSSILPASGPASDPITLVIAGGIGHSTSLLYEAIRRHPKYAPLASGPHGLDGLPEARVIERILKQYWPNLAEALGSGQLRLLIDDQSTNCGQNAEFAKRLLDGEGVWPDTIVLVQDPTMSRRTRAGLDKYYTEAVGTIAVGKEVSPRIWTWPTFVPRLRAVESSAVAGDERMPGVEGSPGHSDALWEEGRFVDLLLGEIPRLRDDPAGYGPKGKGFIGHVDIPEEVEEAWRYLAGRFEARR